MPLFSFNSRFKKHILISIATAFMLPGNAQVVRNVGVGWANNSVNTVVFRKNSLVTFGNTQYISYYDAESFLMVGKRNFKDKTWALKKTHFKGNTSDAHNTISMMVDGDGYLHLAWDHHGNSLRYCKGIAPGSLEMSEKIPMTGSAETNVTYPEFHLIPNGDLLFFYRDGQSGQGNLVLNYYNTKGKKWAQLHSNLIDGEKQRNAYWQACIDAKGTIHLSWVWRESADVSSNHDMCYAQSKDGGISWQKSNGEKYVLPIKAANAEYAAIIPQRSELINQTSMFADSDGKPFIATYWREKGDSIPQYHVIYKTGDSWTIKNLGFRKTVFSLSGTGSKRVPISRPQIVSWKEQKHTCVALVFRDEERGNRVSLAINKNIDNNIWTLKDITKKSVGFWEPTYDTGLWTKRKKLHLFVQLTEQIDGEGKADIAPQMVQVIEYDF